MNKAKTKETSSILLVQLRKAVETVDPEKGFDGEAVGEDLLTLFKNEYSDEDHPNIQEIPAFDETYDPLISELAKELVVRIAFINHTHGSSEWLRSGLQNYLDNLLFPHLLNSINDRRVHELWINETRYFVKKEDSNSKPPVMIPGPKCAIQAADSIRFSISKWCSDWSERNECSFPIEQIRSKFLESLIDPVLTEATLRSRLTTELAMSFSQWIAFQKDRDKSSNRWVMNERCQEIWEEHRGLLKKAENEFAPQLPVGKMVFPDERTGREISLVHRQTIIHMVQNLDSDVFVIDWNPLLDLRDVRGTTKRPFDFRYFSKDGGIAERDLISAWVNKTTGHVDLWRLVKILDNNLRSNGNGTNVKLHHKGNLQDRAALERWSELRTFFRSLGFGENIVAMPDVKNGIGQISFFVPVLLIGEPPGYIDNAKKVRAS